MAEINNNFIYYTINNNNNKGKIISSTTYRKEDIRGISFKTVNEFNSEINYSIILHTKNFDDNIIINFHGYDSAEKIFNLLKKQLMS